MDRRTFNKLVALGPMGKGALARLEDKPIPAEDSSEQTPAWPHQCYRRLLIDTHVPDWNPKLLASFDAAEYVGTIAGAGFQSLMQYAKSEVGLCLWPSKIGPVHRNMKGRDYFSEVVNECHRHGIHPICYFAVMFDNWAFAHNPDWRIMPAEGEDPRLMDREAVVCPNSPYRGYSVRLVRELVGNYDIEGIFFDMTLWPTACYCGYCTQRFWKECGTEPPRVVDWDDPLWRDFQKMRQSWLLEFCQLLTRNVKEVRPISVYHQYSTNFSGWKLGVPLELNEACDFVGGDFYGGPAQYSLVCKAYTGLTHARPFEFHTSRTRNLLDHETTKPLGEPQISAFVATLHSAALMFIDAINPDGTINPQVYELLGKINTERAPYEPYLGGNLIADVAIYCDKESMYDPEGKSVHITKLGHGSKTPHLDAVLGAARILREAHIPFGVVTNATLEQLKDYRAVIIPNVLEMTAEQATRFAKFVEEGGVLYVSGASSLDRFDKAGPRFLLEEVLGVRYDGILGARPGSAVMARLPLSDRTNFTYLTPKDSELKKLIWPQANFSFPGPMVRARVTSTAQVLATVTLPFTDPEVGNPVNFHFAALHSNPPALGPGPDPGVVVNSYGKGKTMWVAGPIESVHEGVNTALVLSLLRRVLSGPFWFEADTHPSVEMTLFDQPEKRRLLAGLLNMQQELPAIPVGATVRVRLPSERRLVEVVRLPDKKMIPFERVGPYVQFRIEPFELLAMSLVRYE